MRKGYDKETFPFFDDCEKGIDVAKKSVIVKFDSKIYLHWNQ